MKKFITLFLVIICLAGCTGRASDMASKQARYRDLTVLQSGEDRYRVIAELGVPELSDERDGKKVDIFRFIQGYSKGARTSRSFAHGAMNVATFGIWDVVGKPIETAFDGKEVKLKVEYDADDRVSHVTYYNH